MTIERFGSLDGTDVLAGLARGTRRVRGENPHLGRGDARSGRAAHGRIRSGWSSGLNSIEDYVAHSPYFGAIVGRYANRIGKARFTWTARLTSSMPTRAAISCTAARMGFGTAMWSMVDHTPLPALTLGLVSEDGDMGYPGRLIATCTYTLAGSPRPCGSRSRRRATGRRRSTSPRTAISTSTAAPIILSARADDRGRLHHADPARRSSPPARSWRSAGTDYDFRPPARSARLSRTTAFCTTSISCCCRNAPRIGPHAYPLRGTEADLAHAATLSKGERPDVGGLVD